MTHKIHCLVKITLLLAISPLVAVGQKPGQQGGQGSQGAAGGQGGQSGGASASGQGLQGLSYTPSEWPYLVLPDVKGAAPTFREGRTVVCYRVAKANSSSQPFILEPLKSDEIEGSGFYRPCGDDGKGETDREGQRLCKSEPARSTHHWSACSALKDRIDPLLMNQILVIGVDVSGLGEMGVNIDQLKMLNINVTNQQGGALNPSPIRPSFPVTNAGGGGGGQGGSPGSPRDTSGRGNWWNYVGSQTPEGAYPTRWKERHKYNKGDVVTDSTGQRFYVANRDFPNGSGPKPIDPFPSQPRVERIADGSMIWQEMNDPVPGTVSFLWTPHTNYSKNAIVCAEREGTEDETPGPQRLVEERNPTQQAPTIYLVAAVLPGPSRPNMRASNESAFSTPQNPQKMCQDIHTPKIHLHYYFAIKGGKSGAVPADPLSIGIVPRAIYLSWPYELPPDVMPTFNVNLVYSPPVPGAPWQGNTFYPAGSVVTSSTNKGHYYTALTGGFSASEPGEPVFPVDTPPTHTDGTLLWMDSGTTVPIVPSGPGAGGAQGSGGGQGNGGGQGGGGSGGGKAQLWFQNTHYLLGDVILNPDNGHYYTVVGSTGGFSGPAPAGQTAQPDPFPPTPGPISLKDGDIQWSMTNTKATNAWTKMTKYSIGATMLASNGVSYVMTSSSKTSGSSDSTKHFPANPTPNVQQIDKDILWLYSPLSTATRDWQSDHTYTLSNAVLDGDSNVYVMVGTVAGNSGSSDPVLQNGFAQVTISDGDLLWADIGTSPPVPAPGPWVANNSYNLGDTVYAANGHSYQVIRFVAGISGPEKPSFSILQPTTLIEPETIIADSGPPGLRWLDLGVVRPLGLKTGEPLRWQPGTFYLPDSVIFVPGIGGGRYFRALNGGGLSGDSSPFLNLTASLPITWQDSGTTSPSSVASGQPADQNVSLINLTLPQTHSLSYFNISAGVVVDTARPPLFGFVPASNPSIKLPPGYIAGTVPTSTPTSQLGIEPTTGCTVSTTPVTGVTPTTFDAYFCPTRLKTKGPYPVDPVLALTLYFPPVDAETPLGFKWRYLKRDLIPGISFGLSLSNPTTNFYAGGSNEILVRNVQLFYGVAFHNIARNVGPGPSQPVWGGVGTAPAVATVSGFQKGFFIGGTFNLSGFIQSLFSGGGAK